MLKYPTTPQIEESYSSKFQNFLKGEVRYTALLKAFPAEAAELFKAAQENALWRYNSYKRMNDQSWE